MNHLTIFLVKEGLLKIFDSTKTARLLSKLLILGSMLSYRKCSPLETELGAGGGSKSSSQSIAGLHKVKTPGHHYLIRTAIDPMKVGTIANRNEIN